MAAYATGFGGYASGAEPPDWTQTGGSYTWTVSADANALYGKSAAVSALTSAGFKTWNGVPSTADVEILVIAKLPLSLTTGDAFFRPACRVDATGANGYFADWQFAAGSIGLNIFKRVANTNTLLGNNGTRNFNAGDVVAMRFRVVGTTLSLKAWLWPGAEPGSWDISLTDGAVTAAGSVGIRKAAATQTDAYYWFSVGTGGETASSPFFAATGAFALTGVAGAFRAQEPVSPGACALSGIASSLQVRAPLSATSYALAGQSTAFLAVETEVSGAFALAGQPASVRVQASTVAASFTLAGRSATFDTDLVLAVGAFTLAGQVFFDPAEVVAPGRFMLTGASAFLSYDLLGGGSSISGGTFSRARWREMLAEEERRRADEERRSRDEKLRRKAERRRREAAFVEARPRSREQARAQADAALAALSAQHADAAARGVEDLKALAMRASAQVHAAALAHATPPIDDDEEEAIALLMLAHAHR